MKRLFYLLLGLVLLPALLYAQGSLSLKDINDNLTNNYYNKTASDARYATTTYGYSSAEVDILLAPKANKTYVNATDEAIISDNDSQDVQIEANRVAITLKASQTDMDSAEAKINQIDIRSNSTEVGLDAHIDNLSNPHQVTATQTSYTDTYSIAATTVQSAIDTIEAWLGGLTTDNKIYGFVDPVTATLSYDPTTQTFTITGDHDVYINGKRYTKTTASKTHPATTGTHYFYYDSGGVLQTSTSPWNNDFFNVCHIAYVYYNASKVSAPKGLLFDEEHSYIMTTATHYYLHTTRGATSSDLFALGDYSLSPAVPTNAGNQFSTTGGTLVDEDHRETIADVPDGGYYPIFWREGTSGNWTWQSGTYPVLVGSNYPMYNQLTGGSWTTTEISANNWVNMYVAVTNSADSTYSVILLMGQQLHTTLASAQAANPLNTMSFGNLPFNEIIITNKVTFRAGAGYGTIGKCRIESVESLAGITIRLGTAVVATSHSSLSGRTDAGSHPATAISTTWTNVQVSLDSIETAIQSIIVGSGFATTAQVSQEVLVHNASASAHSSLFATAGQQTVTVTAGEALTAGEVVSLINSGGTMKAYNNPLTVNTSPNGAESVFNSAATSYCSAVALDSTRFLVAYKDSDNKPYAIIGTVSGSTIAWGSESAVLENVTASFVNACKIDTDKVLVCYYDYANVKGKMVVLSISTATITVNTPAEFYAAQATLFSSTLLEANKVLVCYGQDGPDHGYANIVTISGTTPAPNTSAEFNNATTAYISVSALSATSAIVAYQDGGNSNYGTAQVLSISGATITPGTEYVFEGAGSTDYISTDKLTTSTALIGFRIGGAAKVLVAYNLSTTPNFGSAVSFSANGIYGNVKNIDGSNASFVWYYNNTTSGFVNTFSISSNSITKRADYAFNTTGTTYYLNQCYLGSNKIVIAYQGNASNNYGTAVVNQWATTNYASVSGISSGAYSSGSDAVVLISGVSDDQSGLIVGSPYFLQSDFTIGTTPVSLAKYYNSSTATGEIKIGTAKSATELVIGIDYR